MQSPESPPTTPVTAAHQFPVERIALTAAEVCEALQISDTSLWRLSHRGLLVPIPGIRHRRYSVEAVRRFASGR